MFLVFTVSTTAQGSLERDCIDSDINQEGYEERVRVKLRSGNYSRNSLKQRQALCPPKPSELERTTFIFAFRASLGT